MKFRAYASRNLHSHCFSYVIATVNQSLSLNMSTCNSEYPMPSSGLVPCRTYDPRSLHKSISYTHLLPGLLFDITLIFRVYVIQLSLFCFVLSWGYWSSVKNQTFLSFCEINATKFGSKNEILHTIWYHYMTSYVYIIMIIVESCMIWFHFDCIM